MLNNKEKHFLIKLLYFFIVFNVFYNVDAIVDKWVLKHPAKTYAMDFFEKFPNARRNEEGTPATLVCRKELYSDELPCIWYCGGCTKCWNREMKEE